MDGITIIVASGALSGGFSTVVIYAVKKIIESNIKRIEKQINIEREDRIKKDDQLQKDIRIHGHKGLDGNDARVTI